MTLYAFGSLTPLRSVLLPKANLCNLKCVYYVLTQIVYNVTLDRDPSPTAPEYGFVGEAFRLPRLGGGFPPPVYVSLLV